jgi:hypothetical protein
MARDFFSQRSSLVGGPFCFDFQMEAINALPKAMRFTPAKHWHRICSKAEHPNDSFRHHSLLQRTSYDTDDRGESAGGGRGWDGNYHR